MTYTIRVLLCAVCPAIALAAPGEDHWSVEMDPADAAALEESAALIATDRYCEALPILEELEKAIPANADVFNMLGYVQRKMGELAESSANYAHALYLDPDHLAALSYQGELFLLQGDLKAAEANLKRLDSLCAAPCEERDDLAVAISAWTPHEN